MLKITEFLDIDKIAQLRELNGAELDQNDNFSWHIALTDGGRLLGVARMFRTRDGDFYIDRPYLYSDNSAHGEMLTRTLLLKAQTIGGANAVTRGSAEEYAKYGFKQASGGTLTVAAEDILFPRSCGGSCTGCGKD